MPFEWKNYLDLAKKLKDESDEASHRAAISRAYYCVFNLAKEYAIENLDYEFRPDIPSHTNLWRCYEKKGRTFKIIRDKGISLKDKRRNADYEIEFEELERNLKFALKDAKDAIYWLEQVQK